MRFLYYYYFFYQNTSGGRLGHFTPRAKGLSWPRCTACSLFASRETPLGLAQPFKPQASRGFLSVSETRSAFFRWDFSKDFRWNWKNSITSPVFSYSFLVFFRFESHFPSKNGSSFYTYLLICSVCSPMLEAGIWGKPCSTVLHLSLLAYFGHSCHVTFQRQM